MCVRDARDAAPAGPASCGGTRKLDLYSYRPTRVEISLDALRRNLLAFRRALPDGVAVMAVVKANAYGHGAVMAAREAEAAGAAYLGVAFLDEALELRRAGVGLPILVLGYTPPEGLAVAARHRVTLTVFSEDVLEALRAGRQGDAPLAVHVKIDTGMGRLGLLPGEDAVRFVEALARTPGVLLEGLFTHYACADEADKRYTREQYVKFRRFVETLRARGLTFRWVHAGNSAAGLDTPEWTFNMLRLGIGLYGLYPSEEVNRRRVALEPVMSFRTAVVHLKTLPPNSGVSYGAVYRTSGYERIATLPVGYADGYSRMLTGKAEVLIRGVRAPVVGRICMDQCMVRVDGVPGVSLHDEVVLFGKQGDACLPADEVARWLGTIHYEVTCMVSHRVPRIYLRNGEPVSAENPLIGEDFGARTANKHT